MHAVMAGCIPVTVLSSIVAVAVSSTISSRIAPRRRLWHTRGTDARVVFAIPSRSAAEMAAAEELCSDLASRRGVSSPTTAVPVIAMQTVTAAAVVAAAAVPAAALRNGCFMPICIMTTVFPWPVVITAIPLVVRREAASPMDA